MTGICMARWAQWMTQSILLSARLSVPVSPIGAMSVAFSPDSKRLASASDDRTVKVC